MSESPVDKEKLRHKIHFIQDAVRRLEEIRGRGRDAFLADGILQAAAVHLLQTGVEAMLDAANHIVARERLGLPKTYRESMELLLHARLLPADKGRDFINMVRFRNRAVHLYDTIEPGEIYAILEDHLGDFEVFVRAILDRYFANPPT